MPGYACVRAPFFNNLTMFYLNIFDSMEQCTPEEVQRLLPLVSEQRRQEALKFKHLLGQYCCLKSYVMLHEMLVEHGLVAETCRPEFERNAHGKPELKDIPGVYFNLSHTKLAIAVAIGDHPVGVDVEGFKQPTEGLLHYTMNEKEIERVQQADHPEQAFTTLWTQKEAVFKYTGTGINSSIKELLTEIPLDVVMESSLNLEKGYALTLVRVE